MLTVKSGALKGRQFDNLLDYMDAEEELQATCEHRDTTASACFGS